VPDFLRFFARVGLFNSAPSAPFAGVPAETLEDSQLPPPQGIASSNSCYQIARLIPQVPIRRADESLERRLAWRTLALGG
jgi:hypothetical protein